MLGLSTTDTAATLTDEELLARSVREPWLFATLLERYQEAFLRKTRTILYNEQDVEEVVQDAFTKIYLNAGRFEVRAGAKFSSWAYTILINTALTRYQKCVRDGKRTLTLDPELFEQFGDQGEHSAFAHNRDAIERVLARLPSHFASVLRLHYLEQWPQEDIATAQGESVGAIKARIHRAKAFFRKEAGTGGDSVSLFP
jgi:RNA polymerase sigma-70 factor (ECF subfamily)